MNPTVIFNTRNSYRTNPRIAPSVKAETRPNSSHCAGNGYSRATLPPTPPMSSDASFEGYNSPSTRSVSVVSGPNYYYETTPPLEDVHRQQMAAAAPRMAVQASAYSQPTFAAPYLGQTPMPPYYPATLPGTQSAQPQISGLYYQRPLPQVGPNTY